MGINYLIDTNVLIDAQTNKLPTNSLEFLGKIIDEEFTISFITYIEYLGYPAVTCEMEDWLKLAKVIEINTDIIDKTIEIRKKYKIKTPDAIIAATAIINNQTLITNNEKDFGKIIELTTVNPYNF